MELNHTAMKALLDAFDRSDWQEMTVTVGEDRLHVSRDASSNGAAPAAGATAPAPAVPASTPVAAPEAPAAPAPPSAPAPEPATSAGPGTGTVVESPSGGLFWRAPSPADPPFVEVGDRVEAGATIAIVEVMKLMNHVKAGASGVVRSVHVDDATMIEHGQLLFTIDTSD